MEIKIGEITLTTEHASASYGMPVAILDGIAYGPRDSFPGEEPVPWLREYAAQTVLNRAHELGIKSAEEGDDNLNDYISRAWDEIVALG